MTVTAEKVKDLVTDLVRKFTHQALKGVADWADNYPAENGEHRRALRQLGSAARAVGRFH